LFAECPQRQSAMAVRPRGVRLALHIHQLDFPFDAQWAIISNDYLC